MHKSQLDLVTERDIVTLVNLELFRLADTI